MARTTCCKFHCESVTHFPSGQESVVLAARYDKSLPEDQRFSEATPMGEMKFSINNPAVKGFFEPGKTYYIEVTPSE
jgi:hypothetical protein